jgi:hypothetical protein
VSLAHSDLQKTEAKGTDRRNRFEFGLTVKLRKPESENPQDAGNGANPAPPKAAAPAVVTPPAQTPASTEGKP